VKALMIGSLAILAVLMASTSVQAQTDAEPIAVSCKAKAKQIAADAYRGCIADEKNGQIDQIKHDYQVKMLALKKYYEQQLKKLGSADKAETGSERQAPSKVETENLEEIERNDDAALMVPSPEVQNFAELPPSNEPEMAKETQAAAETPEISETELAPEPQVQLMPLKAKPASKRTAKRTAKSAPKKSVKKSTAAKLPAKKIPLANDSALKPSI
jgi:hypothetical protein